MTEKEQIQNQIQELQEKLKKLEELSQTKSPVEEAFKDWWGQYPETGTWDGFDEKRWQGFQAGYEFAYAISTAKEVMEKVQKEQEVEPSMTNCVITGNPPDGYVTWKEWYNELGSKGILHKLRISSIEQEVREWDVVRESVKWCEEHPGENPLDWVKPKTQEQDPEMLLLRQGKVDIVDYNHRTHYRIKYTDSFSGVYKWFVRKLGEIPFLEEVRDVNVYSPLEELYQKEVMKQKDDYPYKKYTPEQVADGLKEAFREAVKQGVVSSVDKVSNEEDNDKNFKNSLDLIKEWGEKNKPKTLYQICMEWWNEVFVDQMDDDICVDVLVNKIDKEFIPSSSKTNSYAWNKCLKIMRDRLR